MKHSGHTEAPERPLGVWSNLLWGVYWGICGFIFYSLVAAAILLARGSAAFHAAGTTLGGAITGYLAGGLGAGIMLGLLRPLARWWWGAAVMGFFCALPVWFATMIAVQGFARIAHEDLQAILLFSAATGPICGVIVRRRTSGA
jgi:hypothetical protein